MKHCPHCYIPLIEIDYYGDRLIGCIECKAPFSLMPAPLLVTHQQAH
jgi:hypothetical protein